MRVELFRFLAVFVSMFCMLGGFALGNRVGGLILQSGVIGIGPQGGWLALLLGFALCCAGAAGAAAGALVQHRLVPSIGAVVLSDEQWQQHAAPLAAQSSLHVALFTTCLLPFLLVGIGLGFAAGMSLARAGLFGLEPSGWSVLFVSLGLAMIGVYLCALVGYLLVLSIGRAMLGRERLIQIFDGFPKEPQARAGFLSRLLARPLNLISNRVLGTDD
jgi:hypothetical protein